MDSNQVDDSVESKMSTVPAPPDITSSSDKRCSISASAGENVSASGSAEDGSGGSIGAASTSSTGRVPKKFIMTWRHACDKTKDRTKDLFKRWRTLPETGSENSIANEEDSCTPTSTTNHGWSVHVWATWVKRYPSDDENMFNCENSSDNIADNITYLTPVQREKLEHFFSHLLDMDRDDLISVQDFDAFIEKLRHFADWTDNSPEFITLRQVKEGFVDHFISAQQSRDKGIKLKPQLQVISLEEWLGHWGKLLHNAYNLADFPVWLQYLPKIIYQVINSSGSGVISRDELSSFYSSMLGLSAQQINELLNRAYVAMTANGEHPLTYSIYRLCFANFLLGRYPNGPGEYIFGRNCKQVDCFPIDYSAMNTPLDQLEQYTPDKKTNRRSVVV
ncbi:uncharacterized protein LOC142324603 [Lycorma delicatula]|uniref:uncharacterized protein LOC142324603 n=1 Tax=Lycorma delicatula TaxID=130591 RepID=UPI003F50E1BA